MRTLIPALLALALPATALANTYTLDGCVVLLDNMEGSPNFGNTSPVRRVAVKTDWRDAGLTHHAVGHVETDASGCFSALLTHFPPTADAIRAKLVLDHGERKTVRDNGTTYVYTLPWRGVTTNGQVVDYGTLVADDVEENGGLHMWVMSGHAMDFYSARVASFLSRFPVDRLRTRFPIAENSNYGAGCINMEGGDHPSGEPRRNRLTKTFMHEFGHWLAGADSTSDGPGGGPDAYCQDFVGPSHPLDKTPLAYLDPDSSGCGHHDYSWELSERAMSEGFADFTMDFLPDGVCEQAKHNDRPMTFDTDHNETTVRAALCDALDTDPEEAVWAHVFGPPDQVEVVGGDDIRSSAGINSTHAFGSDGTALFSVDLADGASAQVVAATSLANDVKRVAADDLRVCATDGDDVECFDLAGSPVAGPVPNFGWDLRDITLSGGQLYAVVEGPFSDSVYSAPAVGGAWQLEYQEPTPGVPEQRMRTVALDPSGNFLVIGRAHRVEYCDLNAGCAATLTDLAGRPTQGGFRRAAPLDSFFYNIKQVVTDPLMRVWILDDYGVSRFDPQAVTDVEQYVGPGPERIMRTGLAPRAIDIRTGGTKRYFFATDGVSAVFEANNARVLDSNRKGGRGNARFHIDVTDNETTDIFCGAEAVTVPGAGATIMTAYTGRAFYTDLNTFLSSYLGLSGPQVRAIEQMNWVQRVSNEDCGDQLFRRETRVDWGGPPPPPLPFGPEGDDDECHGTQDDAGFEESDAEEEDELTTAGDDELDGRERPDGEPSEPTGEITGDWDGDGKGDDKGHPDDGEGHPDDGEGGHRDPSAACDDQCRDCRDEAECEACYMRCMCALCPVLESADDQRKCAERCDGGKPLR